MGSCVSLSSSPPDSTAAAELGGMATATAKVVDLDGAMAQFPVPVTAREALADDGRRCASPCFLCNSDEFCFDSPPRALAAQEALQPGQLYFVLPASMLRRPLSGQDMAALAVKASTALAVAAGLTTAGDESSRRKNGDAGVAVSGRQTARVAPLLVAASIKESQPVGVSRNHHAYSAYGTHKITVNDGDRTVGKTRHGAGVPRLSAIACTCSFGSLMYV